MHNLLDKTDRRKRKPPRLGLGEPMDHQRQRNRRNPECDGPWMKKAHPILSETVPVSPEYGGEETHTIIPCVQPKSRPTSANTARSLSLVDNHIPPPTPGYEL